MEERADSKETQSRGFSPNLEGKENHLKNEDTSASVRIISLYITMQYPPHSRHF